jgi:hypothetical protein
MWFGVMVNYNTIDVRPGGCGNGTPGKRKGIEEDWT